MKRRRALKILGTTAAAPFVLPEELMSFGLDVRRGLVPGESRALQTLSDAQAKSVVALAEVILPATDTPGATDAGVVDFVDVILTEWLDAADRDRFLDGLGVIDRVCRDREGAPFEECSAEGQTTLVAELDDVVSQSRAAGEDTTGRFFRELKRFTLAGYFTSEVAMRSMGYRIVPGAWEACVLIDEFGAGTRR